MGFSDRIKKIIKNEKPKFLHLTCKNFWCKSPYKILDVDYNDNRELNSVCPKCRKDENYVFNNGQKEYEGDRFPTENEEILLKEYKGNFFDRD